MWPPLTAASGRPDDRLNSPSATGSVEGDKKLPEPLMGRSIDEREAGQDGHAWGLLRRLQVAFHPWAGGRGSSLSAERQDSPRWASHHCSMRWKCCSYPASPFRHKDFGYRSVTDSPSSSMSKTVDVPFELT
jgi:hypothetical protein